jgi:hypothetical protein
MFKGLPKSLKILGILTLINTGIACLGGVLSFISGPPSELEIKKQSIEMTKILNDLKNYDTSPEMIDLVEKIQRISTAVNENFILYTGISTLISLAGLFSVLLMFRKNIYGFHLYIVYNLLSSTSLYLIISPEEVPTAIIVVNLLLSGLFIFLYSRNLNWLRSDTSEEL